MCITHLEPHAPEPSRRSSRPFQRPLTFLLSIFFALSTVLRSPIYPNKPLNVREQGRRGGEASDGGNRRCEEFPLSGKCFVWTRPLPLTRQQQIRTTQFIKKVSDVRSTRRKSTDGKQHLTVPEAFQRATRSMDHGTKDLAMLISPHTAVDMVRSSDTPSPSGSSSVHESETFQRTTYSMDHGIQDLAVLTTSRNAAHINRNPDTPSRGGSSEQGPECHITAIDVQQSACVANGVEPATVEIGMLASPQVPAQNGVQLPSSGPTMVTQVSVASLDGLPSPQALGRILVGTSSADASMMNLPGTSEPTTPHASPLMSSASPEIPLASGQISPGLSDRRNLAPRLATLPPPMMASYMAKGSARLTPSIPSRQPPMPVFSLPPLPPVTPSQQSPRPRQKAPLHSIPALPMSGPSEAEQDDADHENAMLDEEEEDMEDADASPGAIAEEGTGSDEEDSRSPETSGSRGDSVGGLPDIEAESLRGTVYFTPKPDATPRLRPGTSSSAATDYFTSKRHDKQVDSPVHTLRPADCFGSPVLRTPALGHASHLAVMLPGSPTHPGLFRLGSRSMVDLLPVANKGKGTISMAADVTVEQRNNERSPLMQDDDHGTPKFAPVPQDVLPSTPTLRRQRSMPIYKVSSDPPPYPDFHPRRPGPVVVPRDEEGRERLPVYTNAIYLAAVMPRKVEFSAPGVQARDRKWRRVLCVLEGTAFRVYKCPPGVAGVSVIESWWEKKVGVGDITVVNTGAVTQSGIRVSAVRGRAENERTGKEDADPTSPEPDTRPSEPSPPPVQQTLAPTRSKLRLAGNLLHPNRANNAKSYSTPSRLSISSSLSTNSTLNQPRQSMETGQDDHSSISVVPRASGEASSRVSFISTATSPQSATSNRSTAPSPPASDSSSSFFRTRLLHSSPPADAPSKTMPEPSSKDHIRTYTLQNAESGLASDYGKRKNVIRARMEGEQFLLQAPDVAAVIDWIEVCFVALRWMSLCVNCVCRAYKPRRISLLI